MEPVKSAPQPLTPPYRFLLRFIEPERLIIIGVLIISAINPSIMDTVVGGLLGFLTKNALDDLKEVPL